MGKVLLHDQGRQGHKVSEKGLEVDRAKIIVIEQWPPPTNVKGVRTFLGHIGFYRRFIKDSIGRSATSWSRKASFKGTMSRERIGG